MVTEIQIHTRTLWASNGFDGDMNVKKSLGIDKPRYGDRFKHKR